MCWSLSRRDREPSPQFSPSGERKCVRGPSVRGARRLARAGVLDCTSSMVIERNEAMAGLSRAYALRWVESRTGAVALGGGSSCCWPLSPCASVSVSALAPFPVPAHRTGRADFPHPALRPASPHRCRRRRPQLRPAQAQHAHLLLRFEAELAPELPDPNGVARLIANRLVLSLVDKHAGSQGPSLHRHYPASSLLRPCPTPRRGRRPVDNVWSCDLRPVGPPAFDYEHPSASCRAHYPGGPNRCMRRSLPGCCGLPRFSGGSASATSLSRPAQAYCALRPNGLLARLTRTLSRGFSSTRYRTTLLASFDVDRHLHRRGLSPRRVFAPVRRTEKCGLIIVGRALWPTRASAAWYTADPCSRSPHSRPRRSSRLRRSSPRHRSHAWYSRRRSYSFYKR